jgi:hypothetical protein
MRNLKILGLGFGVAAAAFIFAMLNTPATSVASDPTHTGLNIANIQIPAGIPAGGYDAH